MERHRWAFFRGTLLVPRFTALGPDTQRTSGGVAGAPGARPGSLDVPSRPQPGEKVRKEARVVAMVTC